MKRLFLAIPLPEQEVQRLAMYIEPYKKEPILHEAKWVPPENFHITALFIGEIPDNLLPEMLEILRGVCVRLNPFDLHYESILFYPFKFPRMIWMRFYKSFEFTELSQELRQFLTPYMEQLEEEDAVPHLTLARLKNPIDARKFAFKTYKIDSLHVHELYLYESLLSQDGPKYNLIEKLSCKPQ